MSEKHEVFHSCNIKMNYRGLGKYKLIIIEYGESHIILYTHERRAQRRYYVILKEKHPWHCKIYQEDDPRYLMSKNVFTDPNEINCIITYAGEIPDDLIWSFCSDYSLFCIELDFPHTDKNFSHNQNGECMKTIIINNFSKKADKAYRIYSRGVEKFLLEIFAIELLDIILEYF